MQVNRLKGVVERYVGEIAGADRWEVVYDPKSDGVTQLEFLVSEIKREERERFAQKMAKLASEIC
jgi:hypothetical protein